MSRSFTAKTGNLDSYCYWSFSFSIIPSKEIPGLISFGDWNAKVGSQETPGVTAKFGLGIVTVASFK